MASYMYMYMCIFIQACYKALHHKFPGSTRVKRLEGLLLEAKEELVPCINMIYNMKDLRTIVILTKNQLLEYNPLSGAIYN